MNASPPLVDLLANGSGSYFALCRWCSCPSPPVPAADDLGVLAAAKASGWAVRRESPPFGRGSHVVVCRACTRTRYGA